MATIKLTIEYDGTDYVGWQVQPNGISVQQVVEQALCGVLGEEVRLHSSGRTDAGVHARGMVAHFHTFRQLPESAYREGVNRLLPRDIAVRGVEEVNEDFHARFSARGKWYRYSLYLAPVRSPLAERYSWHLRSRLDEIAMARAAAGFVGCHDFSAFRSSSCEARSTRREVFSVELLREGELLHIDVKGAGFLKNMVRVMVGTLVEIGLGRRPEADVPRLLREGGRPAAGRTAPPQGLCLMEVWY
ncbi:tRNA pseudouridine synthase A [Desulfuromonas versatilis]|uniref:tRNA pseudouridine synthase A n=1 Tax=Desulfuromonas versatilis TaxID=2802975 RepID=A0ABM8HT09_9BACT|nr:tRNA pseudouridine(38-40) synthase TruA [Desulfuromonas versatilis]BCR05445.1 tRNA pseudouridine synthase A [Desulfuromonas versatilis]